MFCIMNTLSFLINIFNGNCYLINVKCLLISVIECLLIPVIRFLCLYAFHTGVTTMLNFFTTSNGFRSTLPVVSNLTAMNVWDGVCMCFIYASLLEFVCVNYVGRKRPLHNVVYRPGENPVTQVNTLFYLSQLQCIERHQCFFPPFALLQKFL